MTCSKCWAEVNAGGRFCTGCGAVLDEAETVIAPPAARGATRVEASVGQAIDGRYRIDAKIGSGGMGAVYRATRLLIGDSVAIKLLHPDQVANAQAVERFRREAQAAARLKHHNAVIIYDFGVSDDGLVYLVMELVEGRSLREIIKQQGPLTPTAAAEVIGQACGALDEAHRHNIIHRDIKPDNIMVSATQSGLKVKVLDFGIAKLRDLGATASSLTQTGSVVGTPHYMSPEQCLGEELDHRSDIYSLGVVLYESLTGITPFNSPTSAAVVVQQVTQPPPPLRSINLTISPSVEAVVLHALEKRREARPQTAGGLAQELNAAVQGATASHANPHPNVAAAPAFPTSGGVAPALAPTMQMQMAPRTSGSVTPASIPPFPSGERGAQWSAPAAAQPAASKKRVIPVVIGVITVAAIAVAVVVYLNLFSAKRSVIAEIKNGNLVKPEGSSAYDLYSKHKGDLSAGDRTEIINEAVPALEKRGDEIMALQKQPSYESDAEMTEAVRLYTWLNDLRPKATYESRMFFSEGRLAFSKKDYGKALTAYKRSQELDPAWALPLNGLGRVYVNLKDHYNAKQYYARATEVDPLWLSPLMNLGSLSLGMRDYYIAESSARRALQIEPNKASAHHLLAQVYEKREQWCDAVHEYQLALDNAYNTAPPGINVEATKNKVERLKTKYYCYF